MVKSLISIFKPYSFHRGQKLSIESGPRKGDWEVVDCSERKVRLRCPVSGKEFEWNRFCYHVTDKAVDVWPQKD